MTESAILHLRVTTLGVESTECHQCNRQTPCSRSGNPTSQIIRPGTYFDSNSSKPPSLSLVRGPGTVRRFGGTGRALAVRVFRWSGSGPQYLSCQYGQHDYCQRVLAPAGPWWSCGSSHSRNSRRATGETRDPRSPPCDPLRANGDVGMRLATCPGDRFLCISRNSVKGGLPALDPRGHTDRDGSADGGRLSLLGDGRPGPWTNF